MKNKKIIIGILITIILSIGASFITSTFIGRNKPINLDEIKNAYKANLEQQLKTQEEELKIQYDNEYMKKDEEKNKTVENMCLQLANTIAKYYKKDTATIIITKNVSLDNFTVSFLNEKENETNDNNNEIKNVYNINNSISILNNGTILRSSSNIKIKNKSNQKFSIDNNNLLIDYLNIIFNREITDDEKNAINIGVNMNLKDLSSIEDLKNYIYNDNQIKINNSVISMQHKEDSDINNTTIEFTIITDEPNRFLNE